MFHGSKRWCKKHNRKRRSNHRNTKHTKASFKSTANYAVQYSLSGRRIKLMEDLCCPFPQICTKSSIDPLYLNSPLSFTTSGTRPTDSSLVRGNSTNVRLLGIILIEPTF